jgi:hypothetical protein
MNIGWLSILLVSAALMVASISLSHDPREQTAFLERIAEKFERLRAIPPETERSIRNVILSIRRDKSQNSDQLENRQTLAIERIEATIADRTGTLRQKDATRHRSDTPGREVLRGVWDE